MSSFFAPPMFFPMGVFTTGFAVDTPTDTLTLGLFHTISDKFAELYSKYHHLVSPRQWAHKANYSKYKEVMNTLFQKLRGKRNTQTSGNPIIGSSPTGFFFRLSSGKIGRFLFLSCSIGFEFQGRI